MNYAARLVEEFIAAFNHEWRRLAGEAKARAAGHQRERVALDRKIANLIEAISDGRSSPAIIAKLAELEAHEGRPWQSAFAVLCTSTSPASKHLSGLRGEGPDSRPVSRTGPMLRFWKPLVRSSTR